MGKDYYDYLWDIGTEFAVRTAQDYARRSFTQTNTTRTNYNMDQSSGNTRQFARKAFVRRKPFSAMKLLKSTFNSTEQQLGLSQRASPYTLFGKHLVSEYGLNGGYMNIANDSGLNLTPMHIYDLNTFIGATADTPGNYPVTATASMNANINGRSWVWKNDNTWDHLYDAARAYDPRWYINEPRTIFQDSNPSTKVYRKSIAIDYMVYGCNNMPTEYDIRVIRIMDPKMCPDYDIALTGDQLNEYKQNWQNLVRSYTINPMLKNIEPGPPPVKPWFKTIAKKRITIGEQTTDVDRLPTVQGKIYVDLNEINDYAWTMKGFSVEDGDANYDNVPLVDDNAENNSFKHLPYYTSRYYLLIRALSPVDTNTTLADNQDARTGQGTQYFKDAGVTTTQYGPSYDLAIRTRWMTVNAAG